MTLSEHELLAITRRVDGWLDPDETVVLHRLASEIPDNGVIVEVGSYRGRSTVTLALGAREKGGKVYAVDPYEGTIGDWRVTLHDRDILEDNLRGAGVRGQVELVTLPSLAAAKKFKRGIDLLWLDSSHAYADVLADLKAWSTKVTGLIAMHDTKPGGEWQGVVQALAEFVAAGEWEVIERADATSVLRRVE